MSLSTTSATPVKLPQIRNLKLLHEISRGTYGKVYLTVNVKTNDQVAVKIESRKAKHLTLKHEAEMYKYLRGTSGLPQIQRHGFTKDVNYIAMQLMGPSLKELFKRCGRRFSLKTVLLLSDQILQTLEKVHTRNIIHRDLKPANIAIGIGREYNKLFVFDFGISTRFRETRTRGHICKDTRCTNIWGTPLYVSVNSHLHVLPSRRDDLESLGYILVHFLRGKLPWQGVKATTRQELNKQIGTIKQSTPIEELCKGLPTEFSTYLRYCRDLSFEQTPNYAYLRKLFQKLFKERKYCDSRFDWHDLK